MKLNVFNIPFSVHRADAMGRIECANLVSASGYKWPRLFGFDDQSARQARSFRAGKESAEDRAGQEGPAKISLNLV